MPTTVEACLGVCGVYLHRCRRCGYESGLIVHTDECPGCAYAAERALTPGDLSGAPEDASTP